MGVLEQAINYIEEHLREPIRAEDAAAAAGYSYYHFTRLFQALLGESVGSYIKKRRLSKAASELVDSDRKVLDIALDYGFESGESFSRSFKAVYHLSPFLYRKRGISPFISEKIGLNIENLNHLFHGITVHPKIVEIPDLLVAGLRGTTSLKDNRVPCYWQQFFSLAHEIPHRVPNGRYFGICEACSGGNTLYAMHESVMFSELVGTEVTSLEGLQAPLSGKVLKGGRFAVFTHTGSLRQLPLSFRYIWGTWFLVTGEELDAREDFELYDERFLGYDHEQSQIDLYIPIK